jgi:hypothetical protein
MVAAVWRTGIAIVCAAAGCAEPGAPASDAGVPPADAVDAMPLVAPPVGTVWVIEDVGLFADGFANADIAYGGPTFDFRDALMTTVATAGECRLLAWMPTLCDPACPANFSCAADGACRYGYKLDPGTVTVTGVGAAPIDLPAERAWSMTFPPRELTSGASIGVIATGATVPAFAIDGTVPPELAATVVPSDGVVPLDDVTGATLSWPAVAGARYRLWLGTPHGHGGSPAQVVLCDGADTGTVTIAPALVQPLPPLAVPNCIGLTCVPGILRRTVETSTPVADGEVTLAIGSRVLFWPSH